MSGGCATIALQKKDIKHPIKALAGPVKERGKKTTTSESKQHTHTHTLSRTTQTLIFFYSLSFGDVREFIHADARCNLA